MCQARLDAPVLLYVHKVEMEKENCCGTSPSKMNKSLKRNCSELLLQSSFVSKSKVDCEVMLTIAKTRGAIAKTRARLSSRKRSRQHKHEIEDVESERGSSRWLTQVCTGTAYIVSQEEMESTGNGKKMVIRRKTKVNK
ncbi:uncharacterized protein LOC134181513 [Corticium candelabrum]|uniref:uncharacterized protein LOC134181513 n=1 Tax=Corticium candelabrum TaxID=121492 RepID=UPI002E261F6C|nr:uncharacterized protein LOC134181513 [Corticium candelabrum]